jgi:signal transduction histidine kinase
LLSFSRPAVDLVFELPGNAPELYTDEAKVAQILRNLISNALKFTEEGEVRVTARFDQDAGVMSFAVRDTGIGIAPADHERIFEEFSQVDTRVQRKFRVTGLGLPLSRSLAALLGGNLSVESVPGQGALFTLAIPAKLKARIPAGTRVISKNTISRENVSLFLRDATQSAP